MIYKEDVHPRNILYYATLMSALTAIFIGIVVITAWCSKSAWLTENQSWIFDMQFTTALLFVLSGAGLHMALHSIKKGAWGMALAIFTLSTAIAVQYAVKIDLHIDQILMQDYAHPESSHPGRPAPNTALAFICIAVALAIAAKGWNRGLPAVLLELTGFVVFALGAHALAGYVQAVENAYAWGTDTQMSMHTALANIALGAGLLSLSWYRRNEKVARVPLCLPAIFFFLVLLIDLKAPPGTAATMAYIPLVFCSLWFTRAHTAFLFAMISTLLIVMGYFVLPADYATYESVINRLLSIAALWLVAILVYRQQTVESGFRANEKFFRNVLESTVDGIITINEKGIIQSYNRACETLFGFKSEDVIGENIKVLMPDPYHSHHDAYIRNYLRTGEAKIIGIGREVEGQRKNGTIFPMDLSIGEIREDDYHYFVGIIRDITQRKEQERALVESNQALDDFVYIVSHDLKEPLRGIYSYAQFLREDYGDRLDPDATEKLDTLQNLARRMEELIDTLLYFSRLGRTDLAFKMTDLNDIVRKTIELMEPLISKENVEINIRDPLPTTLCDSARVSEIFRNLITNGIKYNDDTNKSIEVGCTSDHKDYPGRSVFYIADNGIGIPEHHRDTVFKMFKRLHGRNEYGGGTGSGLPIVKKIIDRHGGRIWIEPNEPGGTIFYFTLNAD